MKMIQPIDHQFQFIHSINMLGFKLLSVTVLLTVTGLSLSAPKDLRFLKHIDCFGKHNEYDGYGRVDGKDGDGNLFAPENAEIKRIESDANAEIVKQNDGQAIFLLPPHGEKLARQYQEAEVKYDRTGHGEWNNGWDNGKWDGRWGNDRWENGKLRNIDIERPGLLDIDRDGKLDVVEKLDIERVGKWGSEREWSGPIGRKEWDGPIVDKEWNGRVVDKNWDGPLGRKEWDGRLIDKEWEGPLGRKDWNGPIVDKEWDGPLGRRDWNGPIVDKEWEGPLGRKDWNGPIGREWGRETIGNEWGSPVIEKDTVKEVITPGGKLIRDEVIDVKGLNRGEVQVIRGESETVVHKGAPILVQRPPTKVLINHPPLIVSPAPVIYHRPGQVIERPVYHKHLPRPVHVRPVYVNVVKPIEKKILIENKEVAPPCARGGHEHEVIREESEVIHELNGHGHGHGYYKK